MVQLACMTLPYMAVSFERALRGIEEAGYRFVAFGLPHEGADVPDESSPVETGRLERLFARYDLQPVMLVSTNQLAPGQPLDRARDRFETAKALGVEEVLSLGTWGYLSFPDAPLPEHELHRQSENFAEKFARVAELAERYDITVTLKPHTGNTATSAHMKATMDRIGSKRVRISYDPGNVQYYEGIDAVNDMAHISEHIHSFIAKDHRGARANSDFPIPGEGDVRFIELFRKLRSSSFAGPIVVERLDGTHAGPMAPELIDERIAKARENLERLWHLSGSVSGQASG